jgi:aspartyl-tRNA(Asn)/glutamyl-tRNA(Gln) amidotransferase subunit B
MHSYTPTIGLEIHAELQTATKLFCDSKNDPDEARPNVNVCPVCLGYPGALPVINKEAILHIVRLGTAIGGEIAHATYFDRKNYFYPDIPKGYQISQYKHPIVAGGSLSGVPVTRIHLEEDTARSQHVTDGSLIDFNRAGLPLMELVTEPAIKSAEEAGQFARELQLLLRYLHAGHANMEKGEMRVEANVSVSKDGVRGTKVEVKNLNSFRSVERAIAFEIERQAKLLEEGERVIQETRGWNEVKQCTFPQRLKEESQDYRYFPEPDLTVFNLDELFDTSEVQAGLPELPWVRRKRYMEIYKLKKEDADMFVGNSVYGTFFELVARELADDAVATKLAANYIASDVAGKVKEGGIVKATFLTTSPEKSAVTFVKLMRMLAGGEVSSRGAKDILDIMYTKGGEPERIALEHNLLQKSDERELVAIVERVLREHEKVAEEYKNGKVAVLQFLVGQGMKEARGAANPKVLEKLLIEKLH